jgi:hypothetical protein
MQSPLYVRVLLFMLSFWICTATSLCASPNTWWCHGDFSTRLLLVTAFLLVLLSSLEHFQMSGLLREELLGLSYQPRAALVHNLVLLYYRGIFGLDDTGAALDSLGWFLRSNGLGFLDGTLSHCGGQVVRRGAERRAEACAKSILVESDRNRACSGDWNPKTNHSDSTSREISTRTWLRCRAKTAALDN